MAKTPNNRGKTWTKGEESHLRKLAKGNTPTRLAALKLERSEGAVRNKASELGVSLKPTNQSPYTRRKK